MYRMATRSRLLGSGLAALLLITTACTQTPAKVELRGHQVYGPDGVTSVAKLNSSGFNSYSPSATARPGAAYRSASVAPVAPVSQATHRTAGVESIGVSDLPPPSAEKQMSQAKLDAPATIAATDTPPAGTAMPVNLWTKEPHFANESRNVPVLEKAPVKQAAPDKAHVASSADAARPIASVFNQSASPASNMAYMWPVNSKKILADFGPKGGGRVHDGLSIASAEGEPVWASSDGEVVFVGDELKGYGNMILVKHPDGKTTTYAHLSRIAVDKYDRVRQGDIIGYVGTTGNVRDPQLYFAIRDGKKMVDPQKYLSRNVAGLSQ